MNFQTADLPDSNDALLRAGIVVYGCIRDSRTLSGMDVGIFVLAVHPLKSVKQNIGDIDIAVTLDGATFPPGRHLYADEDGAIVPDRLLR